MKSPGGVAISLTLMLATLLHVVNAVEAKSPTGSTGLSRHRQACRKHRLLPPGTLTDEGRVVI
jgi:hypothetical protein